MTLKICLLKVTLTLLILKKCDISIYGALYLAINFIGMNNLSIQDYEELLLRIILKRTISHTTSYFLKSFLSIKIQFTK